MGVPATALPQGVLVEKVRFKPLVRLRKHPVLLALRRWGRFVPVGEERGETDVFAG